MMLAGLLGEDESNQDLIYYAAPLHDVGKIGIPDHILLKKGRLTSEEFEIIKEHSQIGSDILKNTKSHYLRAGAVIALTHHECFDGSGYPDGLRGTEIPLFGRIVGLVDVFDALTTDRPYKKAWSFAKAFELLDLERGKHFDSEMVDLFITNADQVKRIYENYREE